MKTTVKELKAYYVERGGSAATVANITTIPDMIAAITQLEHTSPAVELPKVTSTDNGDVLTVVSGKWAKAAPSGGGSEPLIITRTNSGSSYDLNKTWKEIHDAFFNGTNCIISWTDVDGDWSSVVVGVSDTGEDPEYFTVYAVSVSGNGKDVYTAASETDFPSYVYD